MGADGTRLGTCASGAGRHSRTVQDACVVHRLQHLQRVREPAAVTSCQAAPKHPRCDQGVAPATAAAMVHQHRDGTALQPKNIQVQVSPCSPFLVAPSAPSSSWARAIQPLHMHLQTNCHLQVLELGVDQRLVLQLLRCLLTGCPLHSHGVTTPAAMGTRACGTAPCIGWQKLHTACSILSALSGE